MTVIDPKKEVYVDINEPNDTLELVQRLYPSAIGVKLEVFDILCKNIGIELKSWQDFIKALIDRKDKRYRNQLYNILETMQINPELNAFYFIYGNWNEINKYSQINMNAVLGAIASIEARYRIRCNIFPSKRHAIYLACKIIEKATDGKVINPQTYRVLTEDRGRNMLANSAERISSSSIDNLLNEFGTVRNVINQSIEELIKIDGIGKKTAERIIKTVTFDYRKKADFEKEIDDEINFNFDIEKDKIKENDDTKDDIYNLILKNSAKGMGMSQPDLMEKVNISEERLQAIIRELLMESQVYTQEGKIYTY